MNWSSLKADLETNFLNLENQSYDIDIPLLNNLFISLNNLLTSLVELNNIHKTSIKKNIHNKNTGKSLK